MERSARPADLRRCVAWNPTAAQRAALDQDRRRARRRAGSALPGTLTVRAYACGKPNCRCHADPPRLHGPYAEWTRKIGGKTVTRRLTPRELAEYQPLFDNARKLRALLSRTPGPHPRDRRDRQPPAAAEPGTGDPRLRKTWAEARLTCGRHSSRTPFAQVSPKREVLSSSARFFEFIFDS